jgi:mutator protein MutT
VGDLVVVEVVAAVIERDGGEILITRRPPGTHLAGFWEFPGGKPQAGETHEQALHREIMEELGAGIQVGSRIQTIDWHYPDKRVRIHFYRCTVTSEPRPLEGQDMQWVPRNDLPRYDFPPADAALLAHLARNR